MNDEPRSDRAALHYHLCPRCGRSVPSVTSEHYCANDGTRLLEACPRCGARITSPYARYCANCGLSFEAPPAAPDHDTTALPGRGKP